MPMTPPHLLIAALALSALPAAAWAERITPLAPPAPFNPLTVPLPPAQPKPPSQRVVPVPPRIIVPPEPPVPRPQIEIIPSQMTVPQQTPPQPAEPTDESGADLIGRGVGTLMDNVMRELGPSFDQLSQGLDSAADRLRPALGDVGRLIDDIGNYQAPERLANGDIIIRRRADAPPPPPVGDALRDLATPQPDAGDADRPALANPVPQAPAPVTPDPARPQIDL